MIPRVKPAGWSLNETLTSTQISLVDSQVSARACDKQAGQSETCQANYTFNTGTCAFAGATTLSGTGTLTCASGSATTFQSGSTLTCQSGSTIAFQSGSTTTISGALVRTGGSGTTAWRLTVTAISDANADLTVAQDIYVSTNTALTANRVYTLRHTGTVPTDGQVIHYVRRGLGAFTVTIQREDATALLVLPVSAYGFGRFVYSTNFTAWLLVDWSFNATTINVG